MEKEKRLIKGIARALLVLALAVIPTRAQEAAPDTAAIDVSGTWEISSETPRGTMTRKAVLQQDGESLSGTLKTPTGSAPITNGSVKGNRLTFTVTFSRRERSFEMTYSGVVEGDTAHGTMKTPRGGEISWTAKRIGS